MATSGRKLKVIRDPIHEYVEIDSIEESLLNTPEIQRLRRLRQNGLTCLVYPSLVGTRFAHSIGVMKLASDVLAAIFSVPSSEPGAVLIQDLRANWKKDCRRLAGLNVDKPPPFDGIALSGAEPWQLWMEKVLRIAALYHDAGHLSLCHTQERALVEMFGGPAARNMGMHEALSADVLSKAALHFRGDKTLRALLRAATLVIIADDYAAESVFCVLREILAGPHDVDRADYIQRDGYMSGAGFGTFDLTRYVRSMSLYECHGRLHVGPSMRAVSAVESALVERYKLYRYVFFHHKVLCFDELAARASWDLFGDRKVKRWLFKTCRVPAAPVQYESVLRRAVRRPTKAFPPLVVWPASVVGARAQSVRFNLSAFAATGEDTLDDDWLLRRLPSLRGRGKLPYAPVLIQRRPLTVSVWKDLAQFTRFANCVEDVFTAQKDRRLTTWHFTLHRGSVVAALHRLWVSLHRKLAVTTHCERRIRQTYEPRAQKAIRKHWRADLGRDRVWVVFRKLQWEFVGDIEQLHVLDREGHYKNVTEYSPVLARMQSRANDIPFFLFLVCSHERAAEFLSARADEVCDTLAASFADELLDWIAEKNPYGDAFMDEVEGFSRSAKDANAKG